MQPQIIVSDAQRIICSLGSIAITAVKRPYVADDVAHFVTLFDRHAKLYGQAWGALVLVNAAGWGKAELSGLTDAETRSALSGFITRNKGRGAGTAVVLLGSGVAVSLVRSLAVGLTIVSGDRADTKYFSEVLDGAHWLRSRLTDAKEVPGADAITQLVAPVMSQ